MALVEPTTMIKSSVLPTCHELVYFWLRHRLFSVQFEVLASHFCLRSIQQWRLYRRAASQATKCRAFFAQKAGLIPQSAHSNLRKTIP